MKHNNVAIIGDSGFIGSDLQESINTESKFNSKNINLFDKDVSNYFDPKIDTLVFLAGDPRMYYYENHPKECFKNNFEIVKNILDTKSVFFIYLSTVCVYSEVDRFSTNKNLGWCQVDEGHRRYR